MGQYGYVKFSLSEFLEGGIFLCVGIVSMRRRLF